MAREYAQHFADQRAQGVGLLLTGDLGTGKSHLAAAILTEIIRSGREGAFVAASEYIAARKPSYAGPVTDIARFATADLVVFDDVGAKRYTDFDVGALSDVLHCRYDARLPTIVTTNAPDLKPFIGSRAVDRFAEAMLTARLVGESYRPKVSDDETLRTAGLTIAEPPREFEAIVCSSGVLVSKRYEQTASGEEKVA
jgi:DNA replication protein DnaC